MLTAVSMMVNAVTVNTHDVNLRRLRHANFSYPFSDPAMVAAEASKPVAPQEVNEVTRDYLKRVFKG